MNTVDKRKLNLLFHLAKVDGKFLKSEKNILSEFIKVKGLTDTNESSDSNPLDELNLTDEPNQKIELLYWAIKLIQADKIIHESEIDFIKKLCAKLGFKEEIIPRFVFTPLPTYTEFESEVGKF